MNLENANINNLVNLWRLGGQRAGTFLSNEAYSMSMVAGSEWPNRLWFHSGINKSQVERILQSLNLDKMTIPLWGVNLGQWEHLMSARDFKVKSLLTGMSMSLDQIYDHSGKLTIQKVNNADMASIWSQLFKDSFGYQINSIAVTKTMDVIDYFIAQYQGVPVGTAALYQDIPEVAGIHSIGIIPSERRKGFAQDLLLLILFLAKQRGAKYGVLQASSMGKALYLKTGFKEEIQIKNFIITKN